MELKIKLEPVLMPVAVSFAESAARAASFGERECTMLALSVEELFLALCAAMPEYEVDLFFHNRRFAADVCFRFSKSPPDLRVFNITSTIDHDSEQGLASMGLFLASRACDELTVSQMQGGIWEVRLRKDRDYPEEPPDVNPIPDTGIAWNIQNNLSPQTIKDLSRLFANRFQTSSFIDELTAPGRLVDKVASGEYGACAAITDKGVVTGGIVWRIDAGSTVFCFGPVVLPGKESEQIIIGLCEAAAEKLARGKYRGMVLYAPEDIPSAAGFEPLGILSVHDAAIRVGYRMMSEDFGAVSLVPEELATFVREACNRLALPRDLRICRNSGESGDGLTLFATHINRSLRTAVMTPMLVGPDVGRVISEHLSLLDSDGITDIYSTIDTSHSFNSMLARHLLEHDFAPTVLIPYGGIGDMIHLHRSGRLK